MPLTPPPARTRSARSLDPLVVMTLLWGTAEGCSRSGATGRRPEYTHSHGRSRGSARGRRARWSDREHFGFRDGIAQPHVAGLREGRPDDTIRAGEFVLGYRNEHDQLTDRPLVARASDPAGIVPVDPGGGDADLGRNGSYLVLRTLSQDVHAFWTSVDRATSDANGQHDPAARLRLAAQIVGRWPDGEPLVLAPGGPRETLERTDDF